MAHIVDVSDGTQAAVAKAVHEWTIAVWRGVGVDARPPRGRAIAWIAAGWASGVAAITMIVLVVMNIDRASSFLTTPWIVLPILVWSAMLVGARPMIARGWRLRRASPFSLGIQVENTGPTGTARLLRLLGVAIVGVGTLLMLAGMLELQSDLKYRLIPHDWGMAGALSLMGLGLILLGFGSRMMVRGRQLRQPSASSLLDADKRKPVLFLRSFSDDDTIVEVRTTDTGEAGVITETARLEEAIAEQLAAVGPLIAIGKPRETLPMLGAARNYYSDEEWRDAIDKWLTDAALITVVAGLSPGLAWELQQIGARSHLRKLVVIFPHNRIDARFTAMSRMLSHAAPSMMFPGQPPAGLLAMVVTDGTQPLMICGDGHRMDDYEAALVRAVYLATVVRNPV